jgi:hypothetical protein
MKFATLYRTTQIDGLSVFYRGTRSEGRIDHSAAAWTSVIVAHVQPL